MFSDLPIFWGACFCAVFYKFLHICSLTNYVIYCATGPLPLDAKKPVFSGISCWQGRHSPFQLFFHFPFSRYKNKLISIVNMFPCRTLLRSLCLTIDNGGHITQLMFYLTIMEANILLGCGNMTPDIFLLMVWKSLGKPTTLTTVSLSGFLLSTKIPLSRLKSWDLSVGNHVEGQWLQLEGTSLQLMSHKTWCNTTCLW